MINYEKLEEIIKAYKLYFPEHWKDEMYKWEAIQHFQKNWDINADDFADMFMNATDKTFNLLASMNNFPRGMIKDFATVDSEAVRSMFIHLYDETIDLSERIDQFMMAAEELRVKYDDGNWAHHYQTVNAVSTYLWLKYPDKYYIYKYTEYRAFAKELESDYMPKKGDGTVSAIKGFGFYDEIRNVILNDSELNKMLCDVLTENCYPDTEKITMTIDLGFFVSRFYNQYKDINPDTLHSEAKVVKWHAPVIDTLYKMGGSGAIQKVHQKIIDDYGIKDDELKNLNKSGTPQVINDIDWARNDLVYEGFIDNSERGVWKLTELGQKILITDELAGKVHAKGVKINAAKREHKHIPTIDLSEYYVYRDQVVQKKWSPYTKEDFLREVYMASERYDTLVLLLENKKNLILQGPPGVGKTFAAKRLAYSMMGEKDESRIEFVQFHQNYSYEDFIMGYKPQKEGFKLTEGIFYQFCNEAAKHPDKKYFFIIDEINRGNLSKIFGELLMLIEKDYRGTSAKLAYSGEEFFVPENLYMIGMMNTADRSLAMIDYALRRRFSFYEMEPGFNSDGFKSYQASLEDETFNALIELMIDLNREIKLDDSLGEGFRIGHSYFCGQEECNDEWMKSVVYYDIIPMLREYWFDDKQKVQRWENLLSGVFND